MRPPRPLAPRYQGTAGIVLVFFDDCHCELDGEDSVHSSHRYTFDQATATLRIDGMATMEAHDDGSFVEAGARDAGFWHRIADDGRWHPVDDKGYPARTARPRFPDACRSPGR